MSALSRREFFVGLAASVAAAGAPMPVGWIGVDRAAAADMTATITAYHWREAMVMLWANDVMSAHSRVSLLAPLQRHPDQPRLSQHSANDISDGFHGDPLPPSNVVGGARHEK